MKKKILAIVLCVAMLAIAIVGGTMAYFTDADQVTNVFVSGNVSIVQYEHQFDEEGNFVELKAEDVNSALKLMPIIDLGADLSNPNYPGYPTADDLWYHGNQYPALDTEEGGPALLERYCNLWDEPNAVDKMVSVYNDGDNDVYVRTIVALPAAIEDYLAYNACIPGQTWKWVDSEDTFTYGGVEYCYTVFTYIRAGGILEPEKSTGPSLLQVCMLSTTENDDIPEEYKAGFNILVASQAVQADGFLEAFADEIAAGTVIEKGSFNGESDKVYVAEKALDEAFGAISGTNNPWVN